jgi:hypothetical protein
MGGFPSSCTSGSQPAGRASIQSISSPLQYYEESVDFGVISHPRKKIHQIAVTSRVQALREQKYNYLRHLRSARCKNSPVESNKFLLEKREKEKEYRQLSVLTVTPDLGIIMVDLVIFFFAEEERLPKELIAQRELSHERRYLLQPAAEGMDDVRAALFRLLAEGLVEFGEEG